MSLSIRRLLFILSLCVSIGVPSYCLAKSPVTIRHKVTSGDVLSKLASYYGTTPALIRKMNNLKGNLIRPGDVLRIRATKNTKKKSSKTRRKAKRSKKKSGASWAGGSCSYTVRKGDSLWSIAKKKKTNIKALRKLNGKNAKRLRPGRKLRVCKLEVGGGRQKLRNGVKLPEKPPGCIAPRSKRVWGTQHAVDAIVSACGEVERRYPNTTPLFIGDLSFKKGGYMPPHKSHRTGVDADIAYFLLDNQEARYFKRVSGKTMDVEKTWFFIEALIRTKQVHQFYVDRSLQPSLRKHAQELGYPEAELSKMFEYPGKIGSGRSKLIRHIKGHANHLHVRFHKEEAK